MHGFLKVAKKRWSDCIVFEGADHMDVRDRAGNLLVAARRDGCGAMHCAQKETGAKHSLAVLQHEANPLHAKYGEKCDPAPKADPVPAASQA